MENRKIEAEGRNSKFYILIPCPPDDSRTAYFRGGCEIRRIEDFSRTLERSAGGTMREECTPRKCAGGWRGGGGII